MPPGMFRLPLSLVLMHIREATSNDHSRFNDFVAHFPWGDLLQAWEWGDLKARSGWIPVRVLGEDEEGNIVAVAQLLKRPLPVVGKSILYASRGPVLDMQNASLVREFTNGLKTIARKHGGILLKIDPPVEANDEKSEANLRAVGFQPVTAEGFGGTQPKAVMILDLAGRDENTILGSFHQKWRYNIRLGSKKGVVIKEDCTREDVATFYKILEETTQRDGFRVRSLKYFQDMWDCLAPAGFAKVALAYYEEEPIAGVFCYKFGDKACYLYGASSNKHRNVMPNHLMQWRMIEWAKHAGCKWYDFRGVSPKKGEADSHLEGLNRFKEGFSPRFVEYIGEYDLVLSPLWYWAWVRALPRVKAVLKNRNKVGIGAAPVAGDT